MLPDHHSHPSDPPSDQNQSVIRSQPAARLLVIEDELAMRIGLQDRLEAEGYRVLMAVNGEEGLERALDEKPDLILLDIMLPRLDGFAVCAELRRLAFSTPILMLTAKGQVDDRVHGLDCGADDYLVKPFNARELLARIRALLRRQQSGQSAITVLQLGEVTLDFPRQQAWRGKREIHLSAREFSMLRLLAEARGEPVTRERFLDIVWGYTAFPTTRTVDNHIGYLRAKLEPDPETPRFIQTVHGVGYRLVVPDQPSRK
ncbi:MAG TPA: response regulator transcription factor [Verrucomicrobiota bacterium]|nr:response regulator transcription factor [Verrucomicrobiota bacterium]